MTRFKKSHLLIFFLTFCLLGSYSQERPKIGLVLSGGGAGGLAHIGVLKVIERAGIPIDYIAGTSMGSIVGALYAIGYTPEELEYMVGQKDWPALMSDQIPRADMSFESKLELEKYFYSFSINREGIQLPSGLIAGQRVSNMLAELTLPAYGIRDFSKLPIPYLCIGADIVTGEQIVLKQGILHDAIRASMAIPTYFSPIEIENRLLVDGGFINNFPADHAREMGADFIIGIDVQRKLFEKNELTNMVNIIKQASSLTREEINAQNRDLCDILIRPRHENANVLSFDISEEIIAHGEAIAMEQWESLSALGENLRKFSEVPVQRPALPRIDSLFVNEIRYTGLENVSEEFVWSKIDLPFPSYLTPGQITSGLRRAYGTNYFNKITYQLDPTPTGNRLIIRVEEKNTDQVHVGLHYDNLFNASLLLNTNFRNIWKKGDRFSLDLSLGENPHVGASYFFLTHKRLNYGISTEYNRLVAYDYLDGRKTSEYNYHDVILDLISRTRFNNVFSLSTGLQAELATVAPSINILDIGSFNSKMLNFYTHLIKDSYNEMSFPTKGEKVEILAKLVSNFTDQQLFPAFVLNYRHKRAFELNKRLSFKLGISAGLALGDSIPYPYRSYMGGLGYYHKSIFPFVGMNYMERAADNSLIGQLDFQFNIKGNHFLLWRNNVGKSFNDLAEFKKYSSTLFGTGLTYGYSTPFGPIECTMMISNNTLKPLIFINIGYWIK